MTTATTPAAFTKTHNGYSLNDSTYIVSVWDAVHGEVWKVYHCGYSYSPALTLGNAFDIALRAKVSHFDADFDTTSEFWEG